MQLVGFLSKQIHNRQYRFPVHPEIINVLINGIPVVFVVTDFINIVFSPFHTLAGRNMVIIVHMQQLDTNSVFNKFTTQFMRYFAFSGSDFTRDSDNKFRFPVA